ncbi:MBL fold metallo-hydrolase [Streptomyces sp. NPDC088387]|uniref:MBL fold metallo-hydrolase n=1 Tax=Streptomyces sp. NPDC088387 TaxID=3365859 RepID=UPI00381FD5D6
MRSHRAFTGQLKEALAGLGRAEGDIRAVLLTHGHPDHTGLTGPLGRAGADIWIHERDAAVLRDGPRSATRHAKPERSMVPYLLRRPSGLAVLLHMARSGAFTASGTTEARVFASGTTEARVFDTDRRLDEVPGAPRAVTLPGHTPGSTGYLFPERGLLFTGDALVTGDGLSGRTGPTLVCRAFTHDSRAALAALDRLDELTADVLLPGHGEPFTDGVRAATALARQAGVR